MARFLGQSTEKGNLFANATRLKDSTLTDALINGASLAGKFAELSAESDPNGKYIGGKVCVQSAGLPVGVFTGARSLSDAVDLTIQSSSILVRTDGTVNAGEMYCVKSGVASINDPLAPLPLYGRVIATGLKGLAFSAAGAEVTVNDCALVTIGV